MANDMEPPFSLQEESIDGYVVIQSVLNQLFRTDHHVSSDLHRYINQDPHPPSVVCPIPMYHLFVPSDCCIARLDHLACVADCSSGWIVPSAGDSSSCMRSTSFPGPFSAVCILSALYDFLVSINGGTHNLDAASLPEGTAVDTLLASIAADGLQRYGYNILNDAADTEANRRHALVSSNISVSPPSTDVTLHSIPLVYRGVLYLPSEHLLHPDTCGETISSKSNSSSLCLPLLSRWNMLLRCVQTFLDCGGIETILLLGSTNQMQLCEASRFIPTNNSRQRGWPQTSQSVRHHLVNFLSYCEGHSIHASLLSEMVVNLQRHLAAAFTTSATKVYTTVSSPSATCDLCVTCLPLCFRADTWYYQLLLLPKLMGVWLVLLRTEIAALDHPEYVSDTTPIISSTYSEALDFFEIFSPSVVALVSSRLIARGSVSMIAAYMILCVACSVRPSTLSASTAHYKITNVWVAGGDLVAVAVYMLSSLCSLDNYQCAKRDIQVGSPGSSTQEGVNADSFRGKSSAESLLISLVMHLQPLVYLSSKSCEEKDGVDGEVNQSDSAGKMEYQDSRGGGGSLGASEYETKLSVHNSIVVHLVNALIHPQTYFHYTAMDVEQLAGETRSLRSDTVPLCSCDSAACSVLSWHGRLVWKQLDYDSIFFHKLLCPSSSLFLSPAMSVLIIDLLMADPDTLQLCCIDTGQVPQTVVEDTVAAHPSSKSESSSIRGGGKLLSRRYNMRRLLLLLDEVPPRYLSSPSSNPARISPVILRLFAALLCHWTSPPGVLFVSVSLCLMLCRYLVRYAEVQKLIKEYSQTATMWDDESSAADSRLSSHSSVMLSLLSSSDFLSFLSQSLPSIYSSLPGESSLPFTVAPVASLTGGLHHRLGSAEPCDVLCGMTLAEVLFNHVLIKEGQTPSSSTAEGRGVPYGPEALRFKELHDNEDMLQMTSKSFWLRCVHINYTVRPRSTLAYLPSHVPKLLPPSGVSLLQSPGAKKRQALEYLFRPVDDGFSSDSDDALASIYQMARSGNRHVNLTATRELYPNQQRASTSSVRERNCLSSIVALYDVMLMEALTAESSSSCTIPTPTSRSLLAGNHYPHLLPLGAMAGPHGSMESTGRRISNCLDGHIKQTTPNTFNHHSTTLSKSCPVPDASAGTVCQVESSFSTVGSSLDLSVSAPADVPTVVPADGGEKGADYHEQGDDDDDKYFESLPDLPSLVCSTAPPDGSMLRAAASLLPRVSLNRGEDMYAPPLPYVRYCYELLQRCCSDTSSGSVTSANTNRSTLSCISSHQPIPAQTPLDSDRDVVRLLLYLPDILYHNYYVTSTRDDEQLDMDLMLLAIPLINTLLTLQYPPTFPDILPIFMKHYPRYSSDSSSDSCPNTNITARHVTENSFNRMREYCISSVIAAAPSATVPGIAKEILAPEWQVGARLCMLSCLQLSARRMARSGFHYDREFFSPPCVSPLPLCESVYGLHVEKFVYSLLAVIKSPQIDGCNSAKATRRLCKGSSSIEAVRGQEAVALHRWLVNDGLMLGSMMQTLGVYMDCCHGVEAVPHRSDPRQKGRVRDKVLKKGTVRMFEIHGMFVEIVGALMWAWGKSWDSGRHNVGDGEGGVAGSRNMIHLRRCVMAGFTKIRLGKEEDLVRLLHVIDKTLMPLICAKEQGVIDWLRQLAGESEDEVTRGLADTAFRNILSQLNA
eukprot:GHVQ01015936.1.p1 GENE.GHVQ01015936.1~~GHVQ01015936.1.p1  ORF type:complete len:1686 (-),score=232.30 GHVQ01015936.1:1596-6653(-)